MNTKLLNDKLYSLTFYFRPLHSRCQLANSKQFVISNLFKTVFISVSGRIQARVKPFTNVKRKNNLSNKRELEKIGYLTNIVETTVLVFFFFFTISRAYVDRVVDCRLDSLKVHQRSQLQILSG